MNKKSLTIHTRWKDNYFDKHKNGEAEVLVWETMHLELPAKMAAMFIERWGMVSGIQDGEDSAGRAKLRLATTDEVVGRACDMAALAMQEFEKRDWLTQAPSIDEAKEMLQDRENEKESNGDAESS